MTIIFAILLFSILIFVHELGHFLAAKASGIQVNEFSMFMGPAIFKKQKGETLYSIRCIPIGGYCAMEGEDLDTDNPRCFKRAAWWKRLIVLLAGSFMNFVIGILIMVIVFLPMEKAVPTIDYFEQGCVLNVEGGLQVGDTFLEIDGIPVNEVEDFGVILEQNPGDIHDLLVLRDGQQVFLDDFSMEKKIFGEETEPRYGFTFGMGPASFPEKLAAAWENVIYSAKAVWMSLGMILSGEAGLSDMTGPVGIVGIMNETAQAADGFWDAFLNMMYFGGFIAINLGIMNLLPIPALDGGRVVALLITTGYHKLTGKEINPKYEAYIHGAGMILLLALMAFIMFKDIFVIFKG